MITYEFECSNCGYKMEKKYRISEDHTTECPKCKEIMTKLISANPFMLKGSGWYKNSHRD